MYNKLFTKILDSSIWLEPDATRIVWLTCIAAMDEDGFVQFASIENLARRANVSDDAAIAAVKVLESPDKRSSDPDHKGRRLERVQGGWMVLNSQKYRELVTREIAKAQTRKRVQRYRQRHAEKRSRNAVVTPSEAYTEARSDTHAQNHAPVVVRASTPLNVTKELADRAARFLDTYAELYAHYRKGAKMFRRRPALDHDHACGLCATWDDDRLKKLAEVFLTSDDEWIEKTDRGFAVFCARASWCDDRLAAWEASRAGR